MASGCRFTNRTDWFEVWVADKKCMISTMMRNMAADLDAGYDYFGRSITKQREDIEAYQKQFDEEIESFKTMDDTAINKWCFFDMVKRGAIA